MFFFFASSFIPVDLLESLKFSAFFPCPWGHFFHHAGRWIVVLYWNQFPLAIACE
jgi:hypothetical protein